MNQKELDRIVSRETMAVLRKLLGESEEEKQRYTAREVEKLQVEAEDEDVEKTAKKPVNPEQTAKDLVDVTLEKVVDKLNMMRSGRSANDKEVKANLEKYFKSLTMGERQSLFVFLDALNQIMTGGVDGTDAPEPDEQGIDTEPARTKNPGSAKKEKNDSIIIVGEAQDVSGIKALLKELQK
jgi:hypothetical protein